MVFIFTLFFTFVVCKDFSKYFEHDDEDVMYIWHFCDIHTIYDYMEGGDPDCKNDYCCHSTSSHQENSAGMFGYANNNDETLKCQNPKITQEKIVDFIANFPNITSEAVIFGGDVVGNDFKEQSFDKCMKTQRDFYSYLGSKVKDKSQILPSIGNHDTYRIDDFPIPPDPKGVRLLGNYSEIFSEFLPKEQTEEVKEIGAYMLQLESGLNVITLHSNYYCGHNLASRKDPHLMANWLRSKLEIVKDRGEKAFISGHIPLVIDNLWTILEFYDDMREIARDFRDIIVGQIYGHDHYDRYQLIVDFDGTPLGLQLVNAAATSGYTRQFPSVRLLKFSKSTHELLDYVQFYNDLVKSNAEKDFDSNWNVLYTAKEEYGIPDFSPEAFYELHERIFDKKDETLYDKFIRNYHTNYYGDRRVCEGECKKDLDCMMKNIDLKKYEECLLIP